MVKVRGTSPQARPAPGFFIASRKDHHPLIPMMGWMNLILVMGWMNLIPMMGWIPSSWC